MSGEPGEPGAPNAALTRHYLQAGGSTLALDLDENQSLDEIIATLAEAGVKAEWVPEPPKALEPPKVLMVEPTLPEAILRAKPRSTLATIAGMAAAWGIPLPRLPSPKPPRLTDNDRIRKADAKRKRRANRPKGNR